jgi:glyoxylase-like metal-dependent hydrolase (beta-lactamase superfamily II)
MIFRQLFEPESSTYTYLLACSDSRAALLIDPVLETVDRDLAALAALGLELAFTVDTHIHADHITSADQLRSLTGCRIAFPAASGVSGADVQLSEVEPLVLGALTLRALHTPGHTSDHHAYLTETGQVTRLFSGDALLIDGCGRTDFQGGDAATLFASIHDKIFTLADDVLVFPAHDYQGRRVSNVAQERERNPRLGGGRTREEFVAIMAGLDLPYPRKIDVSVPANRNCGAFAAVPARPREPGTSRVC